MSLVDDALAYLSEVAENLGLEDDERDSFIDSGMARKGFKRVSSWADPEPDEGAGGGGDFFSKRKAQNAGNGQSRQVGNKPKSAGWQYGN